MTTLYAHALNTLFTEHDPNKLFAGTLRLNADTDVVVVAALPHSLAVKVVIALVTAGIPVECRGTETILVYCNG